MMVDRGNRHLSPRRSRDMFEDLIAASEGQHSPIIEQHRHI